VAYQIEYDGEAVAHLRALRASDRSRIRDAVDSFLAHDAEVQPANGRRKRMRPNRVAAWRLRADPHRIYYDVTGDVVTIRAIGKKSAHASWPRLERS
jgi:mRNA-degrading endonuclease RelE of RelBE toxin-antitoxin system